MSDIFGNIVGADGIKINIGVDLTSAAYLALAALLAGTILILISKKIIK